MLSGFQTVCSVGPQGIRGTLWGVILSGFNQRSTQLVVYIKLPCKLTPERVQVALKNGTRMGVVADEVLKALQKTIKWDAGRGTPSKDKYYNLYHPKVLFVVWGTEKGE